MPSHTAATRQAVLSDVFYLVLRRMRFPLLLDHLKHQTVLQCLFRLFLHYQRFALYQMSLLLYPFPRLVLYPILLRILNQHLPMLR